MMLVWGRHVLLVGLFVVCLAAGQSCPNACSGKGNCNTYGQCTCWAGYSGADCSLRSCSVGYAWTGYASATDTLHSNTAECSNMGTCDRKTGLCQCFPGFSGIACERMQCPGDGNCNGNGKCLSLREAAVEQDDLHLLYSTTYTLWDADKVYGCVCHTGFTGYDCSLRACPSGDDGKTTSAAYDTNEVQRLSCTADGGTFRLTFRGQTTSALAYNAAATDLEAALNALSTIYKTTAGDVDATISSGSVLCSDSGVTTDIEFKTATGNLPAIRVDATSLTRGSGSVTLAISEETTGTREDEVCNGRGTCDHATGMCSCFAISTTVSYQSSNGLKSAQAAQGALGDCGFSSTRASPYCPGATACNSQGVCDTTSNFDKCSCFEGFTGGSCALRTCPYGPAWFDEPTATNTAHAQAECSNMGLCDRSSGTCTCNSGFEGSACERTACKDSCNSRGVCLTNRELAARRTVDGVLTATTYGETPGKPETWDAEKLAGCHCDAGLLLGRQTEAFGPSCAEYLCPTGDNPLYTTYLNTAVTPNVYDTQPNEKQTIRCIAASGTFTISFRDETSPAIDWDAPGPKADEYVTMTGLGTVSLTYFSNTFTCSNNVAASFTAGYYQIITGSEDLTTSDTKVHRVHVSSASWGGSVTTVTLSTGYYFGGATKSSSTDITIGQYKMSIESALESMDVIGNVTVSMTTVSANAIPSTSVSTVACAASNGVDIAIDFGSEFGDIPAISVASGSLGGATVTVNTDYTYKQLQFVCSGTGGTVALSGGTGNSGATSPQSSIAYDIGATAFKAKLVSLTGINTACFTVAYSANDDLCTSGGITTTVTIQCSGSNAFNDIDSIDVDVASLTGGSATLTSTVATSYLSSRYQAGKKENSECSEKGICDRTSGVCKCFSGYSSSDGYGKIGTRGDCGAFDADAV